MEATKTTINVVYTVVKWMQKAADVSPYFGDYPNFTLMWSKDHPVSIQLCLV